MIHVLFGTVYVLDVPAGMRWPRWKRRTILAGYCWLPVDS